MNNCKQKDFIDNSVRLKCTCSYQSSSHSEKEFIKDEYGNTVEDWYLCVAKQDDHGMWITLVATDKHGSNITQIDFDELSKEKIEEFIMDLLEVYDYKFNKLEG